MLTHVWLLGELGIENGHPVYFDCQFPKMYKNAIQDRGATDPNICAHKETANLRGWTGYRWDCMQGSLIHI